ncbi:MAG: PAS domain-containing protein [Ktedonobacterales bacterium]|nr:PAS domain-containing protein [Ktedonobacterales bacterium]
MDNAELITLLEGLLSPAASSVRHEQWDGTSGVLASHPRPTPLTADTLVEGVPPPAGDLPTLTSFFTAVMPIGIVIFEATTLRIVRANERFTRMLGLTGGAAGLGSRSLDELSPIFAGPEVASACANVARTGAPFTAVIPRPATRSGRGPRYFRCTIGPLHRVAGQYTSLLLTLQDASDIMQAQSREAQETLRARLLGTLARGEPLAETLPELAQQIAEALGDACVLFQVDERGMLQVAAIAHRDPVAATQLRSAYTHYAPRRGDGIVGQALTQGASLLLDATQTSHLADDIPLPGALAHDLGIAYAACAPLLAAPASGAPVPMGALLVMSARRSSGGCERPPERTFLAETADILALAARSERQTAAFHAVEARLEGLLALVADGVAIYDATGQLRVLNSVGQQLLFMPESPPAVGRSSGEPAVTRALLGPDGRALAPHEQPWARALRGETVGATSPERAFIEWGDGTRRSVLVRAAPLREAGSIAGAMVLLRLAESDATRAGSVAAKPEQSGTGRSPSDAPGGPLDLVEVCARVARGHASVAHPHIEVRLPRQPVFVALPEPLVERVLAEMVDLAAISLPSGAPLLLQLRVLSGDPGATGPRGPASSSVPQGERGRHAGPRALVRVSAPGAPPRSRAPGSGIAAVDARAAGLGGAAWLANDPKHGHEFYLALPLAHV